jgi:hypothetical protein
MFVLGGGYDPNNLLPRDAVTGMRIRAPLAQRLHRTPNGSQVHLPGPRSQPEREVPPMSLEPLTRQLSVFADYNVFFLLAAQTPPPGPKTGWVDEVITHMIAARAGAVCIGTARRTDVPVTITTQDQPPTQDLDGWDHVTEATITTSGGLRIVGGSSDAPSSAPQLAVPAGSYRVRVHANGLDSLSPDSLSPDGLDGDDRYHLILWPAAPELPRVIKRYPAALPGG